MTDDRMPTTVPRSGRRELILQILRMSTEARSVISLADEIALHPNTIRFHLDTLVRTGRVEQLVGASDGPGRRPIVFQAVRRMDPAGPTNYRLLAHILTDYFATTTDDPDDAATEVGRRWGPALVDHLPRRRVSKSQAVVELVDVLADLGFKPEPPQSGRVKQIRLRHCPFHDLVETHGTLICALHLGLMQGALTAMQGPVTVDHLDPFVEPDLCVAHLASAPVAVRR